MDETGEPASAEATTANAAADAPSEPMATEPAHSHQAPRQGMGRTGVVLLVLGALLVGGVAGVAIGWKVEQQRVKDDLANIRPVGTVTEVTDDSMTIELRTASGTTTFEITDETVVEAVEGEEPAVAEGTVVLVKSKAGSDDQRVAVEVIVLPDSTKFGNGSGG